MGIRDTYKAAQSIANRPRISGVGAHNWPTACDPIAPVGPKGSKPLIFPINNGQNLNITPRWDAKYTAAELQRLSRYHLVREIIENAKDNLESIGWKIQSVRRPGFDNSGAEKSDRTDRVITYLSRIIQDFYLKGDARRLLEDLLVIDAPSVLLDRDDRGVINKLSWTNGADIVVRVNDEARIPLDGKSPAYTQLWRGVPRVNLTSDQIVYMPRNIVPDSSGNDQESFLYGYSPMNQVAPLVEVGILRHEFVTKYYTDGSIPGAIQIVPVSIDANVKEQAQQAIDDDWAGDLARRRGIRLLQGFSPDGNDKLYFPKETLLTDSFDDLLIHQICFAFGVSPQRLIKQMNKASAETSQAASIEEGTKPFMLWLKRFFDYIIQVKMGLRKYEFTFDMVSEESQKGQVEIYTGYAKSGIITVDEVRARIGFDPSGDPNAEKLLVLTGSGSYPLGENKDTLAAEIEASALSQQLAKPPKGKQNGSKNTNAGRTGGSNSSG